MHGADLTKEQLMAENVVLRQRMVELAAAQTTPRQTEEVQQFVQFALDHSPDATCWIGPEARLIYVNDAACHTLGYTRDELLAMTVHDIIPDLSPEVWHTRWRRMQQGSPLIFTSGHRTKDGQIVPVEITVSSLEFNGQAYHCVVARTMTERQRRDETWRQAETIGTMGGSRAHDFNNILASILGYTELAQHNLQQGSKAWHHLQEVRLAIGQAKDLVQHIFPRLKTTTDDTTARVKTQEELPCGTGHILLVDDDEAIALAVRYLLEMLGYEVTTSTASPQALEAFRADADGFDLVMTDHTMPQMTGEQLTTELRRIRPGIPIILCTGFGHIMPAENAQTLGLDAILLKPLAVRELAVTIQRMLRQCFRS